VDKHVKPPVQILDSIEFSDFFYQFFIKPNIKQQNNKKAKKKQK